MMQKAHRFVSISTLLVLVACGGGDKAGAPAAGSATPAADGSVAASAGDPAGQVQPMVPSGNEGLPIENPGPAPLPPPVISHNPKDHPDLKIEVVKAGEGDTLHYGGSGEFEYTGMTLDAVVFDSSLSRGGVGIPVLVDMERRGVIEGWILGLQGMKLGEERRLTIPPELAYGETGNGSIPRNATLVFNVKLLKITDTGAAK